MDTKTETKDQTTVEENDAAKTTTKTHEEAGRPAVKEVEKTVEPKQ